MQTDNHPSPNSEKTCVSAPRDSQKFCVSAPRDSQAPCVSAFRNGDKPDTERCIQLLRDYIRRREQDDAILSAPQGVILSAPQNAISSASRP